MIELHRTAHDLRRLFRLRLCTLVALSCWAGHALAKGAGPLWPPVLGVLLLSAGCSALNQVQEKETDALMRRTRRRPVACGRMRVSTALLLSGLLLAGGMSLLALSGPVPLILGLFAVLWYNGLYTWLKPRSSIAVLPGALCGAIPPLIGWCAAGGALLDYRIILIAGLFFLWQMPHFWLLQTRWREDYRSARLPTLAGRFSETCWRRILTLWIISLAPTLLLPAAFGLVEALPFQLLAMAAVAAALWSAGLWRRAALSSAPLLRPFATLNLAMVLATVALIGDGLF